MFHVEYWALVMLPARRWARGPGMLRERRVVVRMVLMVAWLFLVVRLTLSRGKPMAEACWSVAVADLQSQISWNVSTLSFTSGCNSNREGVLVSGP